MIHRIFILMLGLAFAFPSNSIAQLSDETIDELADNHVNKWGQYLNLSKYRKAKLKKVWKTHERNKSSLVLNTGDLRGKLKKENEAFLKNLGGVLTPNELNVYKMLEKSSFEDGKQYLETLVSAISTDTLFLNAYTDLQYNEILPTVMTFRMELEGHIRTEDKLVIDSIRAEVFDLYDKCLVTCLANDHSHHTMFENLDELIIVELNEGLSNKESGLSKLIELTHKYEDSIHNVYVTHKHKYEYWDKRKDELRDQYILPNYTKSLTDLKKRNGLSSLKHLESDAIFLLLNPFDVNTSRKFLNLGLHNQL